MSNMLMAFFPCDVLRTVNRFIFANVFPFDWIFNQQRSLSPTTRKKPFTLSSAQSHSEDEGWLYFGDGVVQL